MSHATQLAIIDSGGANIASLQLAIERLGVPANLTTDPAQLRAASHVILPGVGAAADCMSRLRNASLVDTIRALRQINPQLRVICASGISANLNSDATASLNVQASLQKPFTPEKLLTTLRGVIDDNARCAA